MKVSQGKMKLRRSFDDKEEIFDLSKESERQRLEEWSELVKL